MERIATIERNTSETKIKCTLNLDGSGKADIHTGIGFFDHMMNSFTRHGFFDLSLQVEGDLEVDTHHTVEDTGIVLGQAIARAVGDKQGITRYGSQILPMDEALVMCALDLCGRPYLVCDLTLDREGVTVTAAGKPVTVTAREFDILTLLMEHPKKVFTREQLYEQVWGGEYMGDDNTVNVHISNLRAKLAKASDREYIKTVWGIGFKMNEA